ncbi:cell wall-binding repeat-containing protein [Ornithinimicrobium sp. LYQ103]|uniref:cell wall-binding repeat-containing protein n=1 Tax=Ornithinimicrobium sp. LYQ103 TaxID=3378796 RepID=UPI0038549A4A
MKPTTRRMRRSTAALATLALAGGGLAAQTLSSTALPASPAPESLAAQGVPTVDRIAGPDRYATAAALAMEYGFDVETVFVAAGEDFPDALAARTPGGASATLLTQKDHLPAVTRAALEHLQADRIVVVGGTESVSDAVLAALGAYGEVSRIAGDNRYATAAKLAQEFPANPEVLFLATGEDFPDALAAGAVATMLDAPILLTRGDHLPGATARALITLDPDRIVVLGQDGAISDEVVDIVDNVAPVERVGGANRYETAALLADQYPVDVPNVFVATGTEFPDALTASALAGYQEVPILLAKQTSIPSATWSALDELSPQLVTLVGGESALGQPVEDALNASFPDWYDSLHVQLLSFNDFHGRLEAESGLAIDGQVVGGVEYLAANLDARRQTYLADQSLTVAAGDLIGGSTFLSGLFHDEPTVEALEGLGLDVSSVGNHEFDEGTDELLRMQNGGCHPVDGCYFPEAPYDGADFPWLAANVIKKSDGQPLLPGTEVREIAGQQVGFIGMTLEETPTLVSPGGVSTVEFRDEVETANAAAAALQAQGVESIVVLLHEGGFQAGTYDGCEGISGPVVEIHDGLDPAIDMVVSGHTHQAYVCQLADPAGEPRMLTSAASYGRLITDTDLVISRSTGDVVRSAVDSENVLVSRDLAPDPTMTEVLNKWSPLADQLALQVVGEASEPITGDANGDRGIETPMANLVADSILWGTQGEDGGNAQISFMNVGGVRASLDAGDITYEEAYAVAPFGNLLVTVTLTGEQIKAALEQQYIPERGRPTLALGVSEGFSYTWDDSQPQGSRVSTMELNGVPLAMATGYRVSMYNFLQEGGDMFTAFTAGTDLTGGPEDLANLVNYFQTVSPVSSPGSDRVDGL